MRGLTAGYILRRFFMFLFTIWLAATIVFIIPRLTTSDPVSAMINRMSYASGYVEGQEELIKTWRLRFGLDDPIYIQYF